MPRAARRADLVQVSHATQALDWSCMPYAVHTPNMPHTLYAMGRAKAMSGACHIQCVGLEPVLMPHKQHVKWSRVHTVWHQHCTGLHAGSSTWGQMSLTHLAYSSTADKVLLLQSPSHFCQENCLAVLSWAALILPVCPLYVSGHLSPFSGRPLSLSLETARSLFRGLSGLLLMFLASWPISRIEHSGRFFF